MTRKTASVGDAKLAFRIASSDLRLLEAAARLEGAADRPGDDPRPRVGAWVRQVAVARAVEIIANAVREGGEVSLSDEHPSELEPAVSGDSVR